ncbi:MAG: ATP-binding protein, partial [Candidatus Omnitrophica bacterium]|nr:ATP-binding protein [Candidatus Omnitrophota bacterium]
MLKRKSYLNLWESLSSEKQMIFLSGPRQVGKTTLAKLIAGGYSNKYYFNWDIASNKNLLIKDPAFFQHINRVDSSNPLIILDEIHKYRQWKNYLKGIYDEFKNEYVFLVSGSGRLDTYQKGGDSLAGRYFKFRLFPFTVAELSKENRGFSDFMHTPLKNFDINKAQSTKKIWNSLFNTGGFPEPFVKGTKAFLNKWSLNYYHQIVREDIRDAADIRRINSVDLLFSLLPSKVGSPLSINNLARDIQTAFDSVKNWLALFESFYLIFRISPWTQKVSRAISKEKKLYLFNYTEIQEKGSMFENMVALELFRAITNWNDYGLGRFTLHFIRNKAKEEVDFLIADNNNPVLLVEAKFSDEAVSKSLLYFQNVLNVPAVQLVNSENTYRYFKNTANSCLSFFRSFMIPANLSFCKFICPFISQKI